MLFNNRMLKIKLSSTFKKDFNTAKLHELIHKSKLAYILNNWKQYEKDIIKPNELKGNYKPKTLLTKYYNVYKKNDIICVGYKKCDVYETKIGRYFCNGSIGIQSLPRKIRHTLCKGIYIDLDFKNAHPTILHQLCKYYKIKTPYLDDYINNRDDILKYYMDTLKIDKDEAKNMTIRALNGSRQHYEVKNWFSILEEFKTIHDTLANKEEFKNLYDEVKERKEEINKDFYSNVNASLVNRLLCYIENECLKELFNILDNHKCFDYEKDNKIYKICSLIFDGLQPLDNESNRNLLTVDFLSQTSEAIHKKTGFKLDIVIKEFDECLQLPENFETLNKEDNIINDDIEARDFVLKIYGDKYICSNTIKYVRDGNIWTNLKEDVERVVMNDIINCNLQIQSGENLRRYSGFKSNINNCKELIFKTGFRVDNEFINKNLNKSIGYLPFKDCVYSFKDKKTYDYDELDICFTQFINRDFPHDFNKEDYDELLNRVLIPIYPEEEERNFNAYTKARALAGHYTDKKWYSYIGERDSGKGVETSLLRNAFKCFVSTFDSKCLINNKFNNQSSETALSWVVDKKECRIIISNEIKEDAELNGVFIKTLASGGDEMEARKLYSNLQIFTPQFTMFINCNKLPKPTKNSVDCLETLISFNYKSKFVSQEEKINKYKDIDYYKIKDDTIKDLVKEDRIIDAYIWFIINNYENRVKTPPKSILNNISMEKEDEEITLNDYLIENYMTTDSKDDRLHTATIWEDVKGIDYFKNVSKEEVGKKLNVLKIGIYEEKLSIKGKKLGGFKNIKRKTPAPQEE